MFPETRYSAVDLCASDDADERARSIDVLARIYFRPVYLHLRRKWRLDSSSAEDAAQSFFTAVVEHNLFGAYRRDRGRFRTFVRSCLDHHVTDELRAAGRQKRGGGVRLVAADVLEIEGDVASSRVVDPEKTFDEEFVRSLFAAAVASLRRRLEAAGKARYYTLFEAYDLAPPEDRPTYQELARRTGVAATDVTNHLFFARKELKRAIVAELRELTSGEEELREEARALGIDLAAVR